MDSTENDKAVRKRRYTAITAEQAQLLEEYRNRYGVQEHVAFREIVDLGFEAFASGADNDYRKIEVLAEELRSGNEAVLASLMWSNYALFDLLRWILKAMHENVDDPRFPACAMSRYMSERDCGELLRIWEETGRNLAGGCTFDQALRDAVDDAGADWSEFAGGSSAGGGRRSGKRKNASRGGRDGR